MNVIKIENVCHQNTILNVQLALFTHFVNDLGPNIVINTSVLFVRFSTAVTCLTLWNVGQGMPVYLIIILLEVPQRQRLVYITAESSLAAVCSNFVLQDF